MRGGSPRRFFSILSHTTRAQNEKKVEGDVLRRGRAKKWSTLHAYFEVYGSLEVNVDGILLSAKTFARWCTSVRSICDLPHAHITDEIWLEAPILQKLSSLATILSALGGAKQIMGKIETSAFAGMDSSKQIIPRGEIERCGGSFSQPEF